VSRHTQFFAIDHEWGLIEQGSTDLICKSAVRSRMPTKEPQTQKTRLRYVCSRSVGLRLPDPGRGQVPTNPRQAGISHMRKRRARATCGTIKRWRSESEQEFLWQRIPPRFLLPA